MLAAVELLMALLLQVIVDFDVAGSGEAYIIALIG